MSKPQDLWSTVTAAMYPLMGALAYLVAVEPEAIVFAVAMLALGLGTGWRHWSPSERSSKADQIAMHLVFAGLVVYALGGAWWLMAAGALAAGFYLEYRYDLQLRPTFGLYMALILVALLAQSGWREAAVVAVTMGMAFAAREQGGDYYHSFWHSVTGIGLLIAFLAL